MIFHGGSCDVSVFHANCGQFLFFEAWGLELKLKSARGLIIIIIGEKKCMRDIGLVECRMKDFGSKTRWVCSFVIRSMCTN